MNKFEVLCGRGLKGYKLTNVSPAPNIPQPNPVGPPSPEAAAGDDRVAYVCPKCKKVFNSKDELELHMETDHQSRKIPQQQ